jgi:hypothetical protein
MGALIGGVSQLYQGDLDLGRRAAARLAEQPPGNPEVLVEDLYYGAVAIAQRLQELTPSMLLLVGAERRGRTPGSIERRRIPQLDLRPEEVQVAVGDSVTGYVGIDLVVEVAWGLGVLPPRTVALEVEPVTIGPGTELSPVGADALERVVAMARLEVERVPLLELADEVRTELAQRMLEPSPALRAAEEILVALEVLDREGRWAGAFAARDRLRLAISNGEVGDGMTSLDWGLWWTLIEELDRLQAAEADVG